MTDITWYDAAVYANARSKDDNLQPAIILENVKKRDGHIVSADVTETWSNGYRPISELEFEFAARDGQGEGPFPFDIKKLDEHAWHKGNTDRVQPGATRRALRNGLRDMQGN